jgi:osmotically-inducible protein OsmY
MSDPHIRSDSTSQNDAESRQPESRAGSPRRTLLAGVAIGAGLSYLFDPTRGAGRRAMLRDRAVSLVRSAGRDLNARAHDVKNRVQGTLAEARTHLRNEAAENEQLAARVRAALGHRIERVRPIEVVAEGGRVVLRGQVPEYEIEAAIATARTVRGVADVENQLQPMPAARLSSDVDRLETL